MESDWDLCDSDSEREKLEKEHKNCFDQAIPGSKMKSLAYRSKTGKSMSTAALVVHQDPVFSVKEPGTKTSISKTEHLKQALRKMGFSSPPKSLPTSFLLATSQQFSQGQIERFTSDLKLGFSNPLPYFFAGSFIFPATLRAVTNGLTLKTIASQMCPATLHGFALRCVPWAEWPAIVQVSGPKAEEAVIHGMMVFGMPESQRARIHRFEGGMFDLRRVSVDLELADGKLAKHDAGVYIWNGSESKLVPREEKIWSPDTLLGSNWHRKNISLAAKEEEEMELNLA
jgi:hypothetical protein